MTQVSISEAKTHLSELIQRVLAGEEIVITRRRQPLVKMVALNELSVRRRLGGAHGIIVDIAADFDAPLADFQDYTA